VSGRHGRHEFLAADLRPIAASVLRQCSRGVRHVLRVEAGVRGPDQRAYGALRAIDPTTGERRWEFEYISPSTSGLLSTASGLIFSGDAEGNFLAIDARSGKFLWRFQMGSALHGTSAVTYMLDGRQHVLVPAGTTMTAWALPDVQRVPSTR
jgi:outer membrane protein assembly factor BamB